MDSEQLTQRCDGMPSTQFFDQCDEVGDLWHVGGFRQTVGADDGFDLVLSAFLDFGVHCEGEEEGVCRVCCLNLQFFLALSWYGREEECVPCRHQLYLRIGCQGRCECVREEGGNVQM
jgi:hypothetical protein